MAGSPLLNIALALADHHRVRATGVNIPAALAALLVPVYLFQRQSRLRQNYAIPIVWCVTFLVSLGGAGVIGNTVGSRWTRTPSKKQIATDVQAQTGEAVTVQCPSSATVCTGASFQCVVKAADGSTAIATVTVQNSQGEFIWHIGP
ncbi:DUF4333 domain-containing protein [Streptomyces sp. NPDC014684]|uniref:DUF4333 domain-containing protein n=1 Tax=Streptomyces sp. NPDC014684 TaxID=3364880 RepID=UPI0036F5BE7E